MNRNLSDEFMFTVPKDPLISPYWASDEDLKKLPPIRIVVCISASENPSVFTMFYNKNIADGAIGSMFG